MIDAVAFAILASLAVLASVSVFLTRNVLYVIVALSALFLFNSLLFLMAGQPLLAVVQLFITVGGISTFLFVGVASGAYSKFRYTRIPGLALIWLVTFAVMVLPLANVQFRALQQNAFGSLDVIASLGSTIGIFYVMLLLMFGMAFGAIVLLRRMGAS